jgi:hypothetical protein
MKNWKLCLLVCLTLFASKSISANKVVFLGDSNTALTYLNPRNNKSINRDYRFTSLIEDPRSKYYIEGLSSINSAVGGAKTKDFLEN